MIFIEDDIEPIERKSFFALFLIEPTAKCLPFKVGDVFVNTKISNDALLCVERITNLYIIVSERNRNKLYKIKFSDFIGYFYNSEEAKNIGIKLVDMECECCTQIKKHSVMSISEEKHYQSIIGAHAALAKKSNAKIKRIKEILDEEE